MKGSGYKKVEDKKEKTKCSEKGIEELNYPDCSEKEEEIDFYEYTLNG